MSKYKKIQKYLNMKIYKHIKMYVICNMDSNISVFKL